MSQYVVTELMHIDRSPISRRVTFPARALCVLIMCTGLWSCGARTNLVTNLEDGLVTGTLRSAIGAAGAGDTIVFGSGLRGTIWLTNGGELVLNKDLAINGPGANVVTIDPRNTHRIFRITNATVNLSGLRISEGRVAGTNGVSNAAGQSAFGAGLYRVDSSAGYTVTVSDCIFVDNSTRGGDGGSVYLGTAGGGGNAGGAAIFNNSSLVLSNCTLMGNRSVGGNGGGAVNSGAGGGLALGGSVCNLGTMSLVNCTFITNSATGGSGGYGGQLFAGTGGNGEGGAVYNYGTLSIWSCTVTSNTVIGGASDRVSGGAYGGGVRVATGTCDAGNTIVANNIGAQAADVSGAFSSAGFNLIGITNGSSGFASNADQSGSMAQPLDPVLEPLRYNGATTPSCALGSNSPAIDTGKSFGFATDQRGAPRPSKASEMPGPGDGADIGAFELIEPEVTFVRASGKLLVSWSLYCGAYGLESTTNLSSGSWVTVTNNPAIIGGHYFVTNAVGSGTRLFRLQLR
jgi:hypothetical protein